MIGSALSTGWWSGWIRCSWSAFTSSAAVGAITSSPRSRWVAGRVSPAEVAARDQDRSMPRSAVPVDPRPHAPAARERDGGRSALEIVPLLVVEHREKFGMLDPVELTAHAPPPLDQARILATAEPPPGDTRLPDEPGAPREHPVQRVAAHERPVRDHPRRRAAGGGRGPGGVARPRGRRPRVPPRLGSILRAGSEATRRERVSSTPPGPLPPPAAPSRS